VIERSSNIWLGVLYKVQPVFVLEKEDGGNSGWYWPEVLTLVISNPSKILCFLLTVVSWASMGDRYLRTDTLLSLMVMFVTKQIGREELGIGWVGKMGVQLRDHSG
jgi:hypothetical protein